MKKIAVLGTFFFLITAESYRAQNQSIRFQKYNLLDGLPNLEVICIAQTPDGFIWIGTSDGLAKFDGFNFTTFRYQHDNPSSIADNWIIRLYVDRKGNLWIGSLNNGISLIEYETGKIYRKFRDNQNNSLVGNYISDILEDYEGNIWIASQDGGLSKFNPRTNELKNYKHDKNINSSLNSDSVSRLFEDSEKRLWIGFVNSGFALYDRTKDNFVRYSLRKNKKEVAVDRIGAFAEDNKGLLYIGLSGAGIYKFDPIKKKFKKLFTQTYGRYHYRLTNNVITDLHVDNNNTLWIATEGGGLARYLPEDDSLSTFEPDERISYAISSSVIWDIFEDEFNVIWLATTNGISKFNNNKKEFNFIYYDANLPNESLSSPTVRSVAKDRDGDIWIGTLGGGLNKYDRKLKKFEYFYNNPKNPNSISGNNISYIFEDSKRRLWIATWAFGLNRFDRKSKKFLRYIPSPTKKNSISHLIVQTIYEDSEGNIWVGTENGLNLYDESIDGFYYYPCNLLPEKFTIMNNIQSNCIVEDNEGYLWIGVFNGLLKFDKKNKKYIAHFFNDPNNIASLSDNRIISMTKDDKGNLWIGTYGGGLNKFDIKNNRFTRYDVKTGLSNNIIYGIVYDKKENIWLSTADGLNKLNLSTGEIKQYYEVDGLQSNQFYWGAAHIAYDGEIFFGGINGLNFFYPENIQDDTRKIKIAITNIKIMNNEYPLTEKLCYNKIDKIEFTSAQNYFSVEFVGLEFKNPAKVKYAYKLEGYDKDWISTNSNKRNAFYSNLNAGVYAFKVLAANSDGIWNIEPKILTVIVSPPFYQRLWFQALTIFAILLLPFLFYYYRDLKAQEKQKELEKIVDERTKDLKEKELKLLEANRNKDKLFSIIAHDLKNPFFNLLGFLELLHKEYDNLSEKERKEIILESKNSAKNTLQLLENLLNWALTQTGRIELEPMYYDIKKIIDETISEVFYFAKSKQIDIELQVNENILAYFDKNTIKTAIRNILSNSIKFTNPGGKITVSAFDENNHIKIIFKDNGIGMSKDKIESILRDENVKSQEGTNKEKGFGLGLYLCKEFIAKNKGTLQIFSEPKVGTTIEIILPQFSPMDLREV